MILYNRRFVILSVVAALVTGTAIASRRVAHLSPAGEMSANRLLEKAYRANKSSAVETRTQDPLNPQTPTDGTKSPRREFTVYRNELGELVCREATPEEIIERQKADPEKLGLRQINHFEFAKSVSGQAPEAANLVIVLRATQQLQQNTDATASFNRAAQNWESVIMSPITIYLDVDFGTTNFGQTWPSGVLGATGSPSGSYPYQSVRANLIAEANGEGNATKQSIFNSLPSTAVPTDLGDASAVDVSNSIARAIGLLPATAQPSDDAAHIAFNSNFTFDFDPSDGITANAIDFDAVATHEIGHALGFESDAGLNAAKGTIWDLYRFRTGTTTGTFPTAQRILTIGGSPDPLQFDFIPGNLELGLSTGGPAGSSNNGGDGWQSSHWKHVNGCSPSYLGIMDPAIPNGCRRTITSKDTLALTSFGYNLMNSSPPPPPPPSPTPPANDNFLNAQALNGCTGSTTGSTFGSTSEAGEPSHDPSDSSSLSPRHTVWYQWQASFNGATTITTNGSDFDTLLAVYAGTNLNSLFRIANNDDVQNGVIRTSSVNFNAVSGTVYKIAVDGWGGDTGTVKLNWFGVCSAPSPSPSPSPTPSPSPSPTPGNCASVLIVNNNGDAPDLVPGNGVCATANGVCTLRAAIEEANFNSSCGTIDINFNVAAGSIVLNNALPEIIHNVRLNGPGASALTLQRNPAPGTSQFRILVIRSSRTVRISGLTISNGDLASGNNGGGIYNSGSLTLDSCNVFGNSIAISPTNFGGGIFNNGTLTLNNTNVGGLGTGQGNTATDGGGIYSIGGAVVMTGGSIVGNAGGGLASVFGGSLTLTNVAVTNNRSVPNGFTGGVWSGTSALITNCLIANNSVQGPGAGLSNSGTATVINTTISGNSSSTNGGGISHQSNIINTNPTMRLTNVTVTGNRSDSDGSGNEQGGGIYRNGGTITLNNTLVAGNIRGTGTTRDDLNGLIQGNSSFNLIGDGSGVSGIANGSSGNQIGTAGATINPVLGALAANGGSTMTHALLTGSPAINAGSNALAVDQSGNALTTDQRGAGFPRIASGTVDIGAYEAGNPIDEASFFVRQQYLDFLNRPPDQSGGDFWTSQITSCGSDAQCIEVKRINVSAAFFLSIEFQQTGNLVYKMYKAGFGNLPSKPVAVERVPFLSDTRQIQSTPAQVIVGQGNWAAQLETNKQVFALEFVQRSTFQTAHAAQTANQYVSSLFSNTGASPTAAETSSAVNAFNAAGGGDAGRAAALRSVAESSSVAAKLNNEAFVLMQYFGYLQRNPYDPPELTLDYQGFNFWLGKLNQANGDYLAAELVKAFITSSEYRQRFGP